MHRYLEVSAKCNARQLLRCRFLPFPLKLLDTECTQVGCTWTFWTFESSFTYTGNFQSRPTNAVRFVTSDVFMMKLWSTCIETYSHEHAGCSRRDGPLQHDAAGAHSWIAVHSHGPRLLFCYTAVIVLLITQRPNNMKLVHWPLMGGLLHLVQRGGYWAGCPLLAVPNVTANCINYRIAV